MVIRGPWWCGGLWFVSDIYFRRTRMLEEISFTFASHLQTSGKKLDHRHHKAKDRRHSFKHTRCDIPTARAAPLHRSTEPQHSIAIEPCIARAPLVLQAFLGFRLGFRLDLRDATATFISSVRTIPHLFCLQKNWLLHTH